MMEILRARAEGIAKAAQAQRLKRIAQSLRERGLSAEIGAETVTLSGRNVARTWISDPIVRFAGRLAR